MLIVAGYGNGSETYPSETLLNSVRFYFSVTLMSTLYYEGSTNH